MISNRKSMCGCNMHFNEELLMVMWDSSSSKELVNGGWIYLGDADERYVLGQPGEKNLLVFGVNPSTAVPGEENLDPTMKRVVNIVKEQGYNGWIMMNLYPQRTPNPYKLKRVSALMENNIVVLGNVIKFFTINSVWCAWGNMINNASFLNEALNEIYHILAHKVHWYHYGELTKLGNPRHPLYVKSGSGLKTFDIDAYMTLRKMLVL